MEKVRVYVINYRKGARRHFNTVKNDISSALHYIYDAKLINRYRVQIVSGDNRILLFDSAAIYHDPSVFDRMCKEGYNNTYWRLIQHSTEVMMGIINMCKANSTRVKRYNTKGYLSTDQYG